MKIIHAYWTKSIFKKSGYHSFRQVYNILVDVDETCFSENSLVSKEEFILKLTNLVESIEQIGDILKDSRDMLAPGSIFEGSFPGEYASLRSSYIKERKKLEKQLFLVKLLF